MRRTYFFFICTIFLITATFSLSPAVQAASDTEAAPRRGIAVLSSSIGSDYSPETLAQIVEAWNLSPVVIDWAWVTHHWKKTNFPAVNKFLALMAEQKVPVAGMYRPRFLGRPTVPTQKDRQGNEVATHGQEICFSSALAREWGISWGNRILGKCPQLNEIIIYNPRNLCECPSCRKAAEGSSYARYDLIWRFLAEAKAAWRKQRPTAKLGVVYMNDPGFWRRGTQVLDVAHPFLFIRANTDLVKEAASASAIRDLYPNKTGACLAKLTWETTYKVSSSRLAEFDRVAAEAGLPYFFWTFETLYDASMYDPGAVDKILSDHQTTSSIPAAVPEIKDLGVKALLDKMAQREPEDEFSAMQELIRRIKASDPETQNSIISLVTATMLDTSRPIYQRWQCCYVISDSGYEAGVAVLIQVLLHDASDTMRGVAAAALAKFTENTAAHDALLEAARQETSVEVRQTLARCLGEEMPAARLNTGTSAAPAVNSRGAGNYSAAQIRSTSTETFLARILKPAPGHTQFDAMNALTEKVKISSPAERNHIMALVTRTMHNRRTPIYQRWQCCYVISGSGYEQGVPALIQVLLHDESEVVRSVAVDALAKFTENEAAHEALLQAADRETSERVREALSRYLGEETLPPAKSAAPPVTAHAVEELAPAGPPQPPPAPKLRITEPLPWPFPGGQEEQNIFNNYQQATDMYIHGALDFIQPAGTPVKAVYPGYVAAIYTNYPGWTTHYFFIVTPRKGGNQGWCYTHLDPRTFTFKEGDYIQQGQRLGDLVDFSVGGRPGVSHLHLHYVKFSRDSSGKVEVRSLIDPLYFFDWKDTQPPIFLPLVFVRNNTFQQFQADRAGVLTVSGKVDILAAISDSAYPGHWGNLGVPVVMLSISDGTYTMQKLVVDHRGDVGEKMQVKPLFLSYDEKKVFFNPDAAPRYQMLRVTKTDGNGRISPRDKGECWDTAAQDAAGGRIWPDGEYAVNVYAWDIGGNRAAAGAIVRVKNR